MDGGRLLRAALTRRLGRVRATRAAAGVGQAAAVGLGILGLYGNLWLLVIAVFVSLGAAAEARTVELEAALQPHVVAEAMHRSVVVADPGPCTSCPSRRPQRFPSSTTDGSSASSRRSRSRGSRSWSRSLPGGRHDEQRRAGIDCYVLLIATAAVA